jgi:hypothetical protein
MVKIIIRKRKTHKLNNHKRKTRKQKTSNYKGGAAQTNHNEETEFKNYKDLLKTALDTLVFAESHSGLSSSNSIRFRSNTYNTTTQIIKILPQIVEKINQSSKRITNEGVKQEVLSKLSDIMNSKFVDIKRASRRSPSPRSLRRRSPSPRSFSRRSPSPPSLSRRSPSPN